MDAQHEGGDESQGALATAQGTCDIGPGGPARRHTGMDRAPIGQDCRDPEHRVLDKTVARRRFARCAYTEHAAQGRAHHRRWVVADAETPRRQDLLQANPGQPGLYVDQERGLVEAQYVIHTPGVDEHAHALACAIPPGTRPGWLARRPGQIADGNHRHVFAIGQCDELCDLGRRTRLDPPGRSAGRLERTSFGAAVGLDHAQDRQFGSRCEYIPGPDDAAQRVVEPIGWPATAHESPPRPSLPGFMMPSGSRVLFRAVSMAMASRCSLAMYGPLSRPMP